MNKSSTSFIGILIALLIVGGAAFAAGRFFATPVIETVIETSDTGRTAPVVSSTDALELNKALTENEALKAELRKLREELAAAQQPVQSVAEKPKRPTRSFTSAKDWMEDMKKKDPERYNAIMERRKQLATAVSDAKAKRADFLESIDTSLLPASAQSDHRDYMQALERQDELMERFRKSMEAGERPSQELREQMAGIQGTLSTLRDRERDALIGAVARSVGLGEQDAAEFSSLIREVYDATDRHLNIGRGGFMPAMGHGPSMR